MTSRPTIAVSDPTAVVFRRHRAMSTAGAFLFMVMASLNMAMGFLVLPGSKWFGVTTAEYLLWYTVYMLSSAAVFIAVGKLMATIGVRRVVIASGTLVVLCLSAMAFAPNIVVFYLLSCPLGIGWAGTAALASNSLVTGWHTDRRGTVLGVVATGIGVGGFIWGILFPPVVAAFGFRGGMLALAFLVTLLSVVPGILLIKDPPRLAGGSTRQESSGKRHGLLKGVGTAVALLGAAALVIALEGTFSQIQPAVYAASGIDLQLAGLLVSYYALCGVVAKPVLGYLYDRLGTGVLFVALGVLFVVGLPGIALLRESGIWVFWILIPVAAISLSVITVVLPLLTVRAVGEDRFPVAYGVVMSGTWVGLAVGLPLWGLTFDITGDYDLAMLLAGMAGLVGLTFAFIALKLGRRSELQPQTEAQLTVPV
ncbi:MFS transporter [Pseudarthrobacter sulfonivorans]|uniref:MFS transporter n=1 Tax=Pseudarthrobacter sulfonivorans TaxID=121292 RepID=UPI00168B2EC8|nr:MFS transporter [Pseudarthrobacter sulfonivorans]